MARTSTPIPARKLQPDTSPALEAICIKAMSSDKSRRFGSATEIGDEIQRFLAGEPVEAYPEPLPARLWRWTKRHRRGIARVAAALTIAACVIAAALVYRDAARVKAREQARLDVERVRHLIDESHFYAANIDPPGEVAPYYDVGRGERAGRDALAASQKWGTTLGSLPLEDQRDPLRGELSDLCLRLAYAQVARADSASSADAIALLDHADRLNSSPSHMSHSLRAAVYRLGHRDAEAAEEQKLAESADSATSAHELFLHGELARMSSASQSAFILKDADARRAAAKTIAHAAELYQASLRADPRDYWAHMQLARSYLELGRGREAGEALGACIALRPQSPWAYSTRGLALAWQHRFDDAKLDFDRALEIDPGFIAARLNRGIMYRLQNRPRDAAAEFDSLLALANPPPEAAIYRGQLFLLAGDPGAALKLFAAFSNPSVCLLRAEAHLRLGESEEARQDLDAVVPSNLSAPDAAAVRGHLLRCIASDLPAKDQPAALNLAVAELKRAVENAPSAGAFADLGGVLQQQGRHDLAIEPLSRAIALSPANAQALINRGWVNEKLNRLDAAQRDFAAALRISPDQAEALSGLGYIAARAGNAREAQLEASLALINGNNDYRILHNVACIYAQLSVTDRARATTHEDAAVEMLTRAVDSWRRGWAGPHELDLIRGEVAFPASLRNRSDFQNLLANSGA